MATIERIQRYQDYKIKQLSNFINLIFSLSTILIGLLAKGGQASTLKDLKWLIITLALIVLIHICRFFNFKCAENRERYKFQKKIQVSNHGKIIKRLEKTTLGLTFLSLATFIIGVMKII